MCKYENGFKIDCSTEGCPTSNNYRGEWKGWVDPNTWVGMCAGCCKVSTFINGGRQCNLHPGGIPVDQEPNPWILEKKVTNYRTDSINTNWRKLSPDEVQKYVEAQKEVEKPRPVVIQHIPTPKPVPKEETAWFGKLRPWQKAEILSKSKSIADNDNLERQVPKNRIVTVEKRVTEQLFYRFVCPGCGAKNYSPAAVCNKCKWQATPDMISPID